MNASASDHRSAFARPRHGLRWPGTLFGRLVLILGVSLVGAQLLTAALVLTERGWVMRDRMAGYLAADVASSVAMLDRLPADERADWLTRLNRPNTRFRIGPAADVSTTKTSQSPWAAPITAALTALRVAPIEAVAPTEPGIALRLQSSLQDGTPIAIDLIEPALGLSPWLLVGLSAQLALILLGCWLAVRQATWPLSVLATAASRLRPGEQLEPLPLTGPVEVVDAARAFNQMQHRIHEHLAERNEMLGAIAHDLQTPITRMRLRTDLMTDTVIQAKLHADLEQMQHLVEQGLDYARSAQADQEPGVPTDLRALLQSTVASYQDAGQPVQWLDSPARTVRTRPKALQRIVSNLLDNAIKFGGAAEVRLIDRDGCAALQVLDRGPGIAAADMVRVRQPFQRGDPSRNPTTGGSGLGLAIVQRLAPRCQADLHLLARDGGGLCAEVRFRPPTDQPPNT